MIRGGAACHVIDDSGINPSNYFPWSEESHSPEPCLKTSLLFQPQRVQNDTGGDEKGDSEHDGGQPGEEEEIADVVVADVDKVKAEQVVAGVTGPRLSLLEQVAVEEGGDPSPGGERERVEGDMPGGGGEVGVEGACDERPTPPGHSGRLQADSTRVCSKGAR